MPAQLDLNKDGTERVAYQGAAFPVRAVNSCLSVFQGYAASCHWHRDLEFLLVCEGALDYFVNGEIVHVSRGQAIFVNADRLHYGYSPAYTECLFSCLLFHPSLLGDAALPSSRYLAGLAADGQADALLLSPENEPDREALRLVAAILENCRAAAPYYELDVQADCIRLVKALCLRLSAGALDAAPDAAWQTLRRMIGYIQERYTEEITLPDVAAAGAVCRSKCCELFRERLGVSPMAYLGRYRLERACDLLRGGGRNITEVARACGFGGASYFAEQFRRVYGMSPRTFCAQHARPG